MIRYLNTKLYGKVETLESLDTNDFADSKAFRSEQKSLVNNYNLAGGHGELYWSSRHTRDYK